MSFCLTRDDFLDGTEFAELCGDLFNSKEDNSLTQEQTSSFFSIVDLDEVNLISHSRGRVCDVIIYPHTHKI